MRKIELQLLDSRGDGTFGEPVVIRSEFHGEFSKWTNGNELLKINSGSGKQR